MFLSSRNNQFKFEFPRKFIPDNVNKKYKPFINKMSGGMISEPIDLWNHGIQSMNIPGPSFTPGEQKDYPGFTRKFRTPDPTQELFNKELTITMKSLSGFINYWMAIDTFDAYYAKSGKEPWVIEGPGVQFMDVEGNLFVTAHLKEMIFTGVSELSLNFSSNTVEFDTFDLTFSYNILEIDVNLN